MRRSLFQSTFSPGFPSKIIQAEKRSRPLNYAFMFDLLAFLTLRTCFFAANFIFVNDNQRYFFFYSSQGKEKFKLRVRIQLQSYAYVYCA